MPCDDFEYFDSRNNNCDRIRQIVEKSAVQPVVTHRYKKKGNDDDETSNSIINQDFLESEIEIFERKFLSSLVSSSSDSCSSSSLVTVNDGVRAGPGRAMTVLHPHHRVLRTSSKVSPVSSPLTPDFNLSVFQDSDCDSGAYSRSSSPDQGFDRFLLDRNGDKKHDKSPLQSPNLVLSVIKVTT